MTVQEFIKQNKHINLGELARKMFPGNTQGAKNYLSAKLKGTRTWNDVDTENAKRILKEIFADGLNQIDSLD